MNLGTTVSLFLALSSLSIPLHADLVIGGFDSSRGGLESLADSAFESQLRTYIQAQISDATFTATDVLTPAYLDTVNAVVLGVASGDFTAITPLTSAEQTALLNYAQSGGTVLIFADNSTFDLNGNAPAANASLLGPFNLAVDGTLNGSQTATYLTGTGKLDTYYPTEFTALGLSTELATYDSNGEPAATWFPGGLLSHGSGPVFAFGDSSMMLNTYMTANDAAAIVGALEMAQTGGTQIPEPATWTLFAAGIGLAAGVKKFAQ